MTKTLEQKIRARLQFDFEAMAEKYRSLESNHPAWSELIGMEFGARWQHTQLVNELAPLLAEMAEALKKYEPYCVPIAGPEGELGLIEIQEVWLAKQVMSALEAWLGKNVRREVID